VGLRSTHITGRKKYYYARSTRGMKNIFIQHLNSLEVLLCFLVFWLVESF
jgi:hypothetical protein